MAIAKELAKVGDIVTLIGAGKLRGGMPYRFVRAGCIGREKFESFPALPVFRNEYAYEELTFIPGLLGAYNPSEYDVTVTCSYPFTNWALRRPSLRKPRPRMSLSHRTETGRPLPINPSIFISGAKDWYVQIPIFSREIRRGGVVE